MKTPQKNQPNSAVWAAAAVTALPRRQPKKKTTGCCCRRPLKGGGSNRPQPYRHGVSSSPTEKAEPAQCLNCRFWAYLGDGLGYCTGWPEAEPKLTTAETFCERWKPEQ
jgi:hypothetical protein